MTVRNAATGAVIAKRVEVATTHADRAIGLLGRSRLERGEGLLIAPCRGVHTCFMRFSIDVVSLDAEGVIVDCAPGLRPWRVRLPRRRTASVLELPAGTIAFTGTRVGDKVRLDP
jgi:uncharacterized membrane protein (UPF0127 family)